MYNRKKIKKIAIVLVWLIVIAMVLTTFSVSIFAATDTAKTKTISAQLKEMEKVLKYIEKYYVEDVDINMLIDGAYQGIFNELDPYSSYYSETDETNYVVSKLTGSFYGVGATFVKTEKGVSIQAFSKNSAAEKSGLKIGDIIVKVDGTSCQNLSLLQVIAKLRSREESSVRITVNREGKELEFSVKRMLIEEETVTAEMLNENTAYIRISNFYDSTVSEFEEQWKYLKKESPEIKNLIVDIRDNTGGLVSSAIGLSNFFLDKDQTIMKYVRHNKIVYTYKSDGNKIVDVPVKLLVNDGTASAAEIFSGALQDNDAACLVGAVTYGKGMAQTVADMDNGAVVKLSKYYFTTPDNKVIQGKGITPSYIIYNGDNKDAINRYSQMKTVADMDEGKKYKPGEKGLNVYAAQQRLQILGFSNICLNGVLDEATQSAIKEIQRISGLYVYGALDFSTIDAIERAYQQNVFGIEEDIQLNKAMSL